MHFDIIAGVSVGALNGAMMAMGKQDELNELWDQVAKNGVGEISLLLSSIPKPGEEPKFLQCHVLKNNSFPNYHQNQTVGWRQNAVLQKVRQQFIEKTMEDAAESIATTFQLSRMGRTILRSTTATDHG